MKSNYEERKANRIERYKELAGSNEKLSEQTFTRASQLASVIPFGQPILVGHHSEKRDRNFRAKINNMQSKAYEASKKASYYAEKAAIAESNTAISSDDPKALEKLKEKLDALENQQEIMKAANKIVKSKKLSVEEKIQQLQKELNFPEGMATKIMQPDFANRIGFPQYKLTNNNANMRTVRQRIEKLEKLSSMQTSEDTIGDVTIVTNTEENRVQILFPDKPSEEVRSELKHSGFRWSPMEKAWQRQISNHAIYLAKQIVNKFYSSTNLTPTDEHLETNDNGPTGHGDICMSDADEGL